MCKLSLTRQADSTKTQTKRKVKNIMKTGKITAKSRDAVPVCLMVEGQEVDYAQGVLPEVFPEPRAKMTRVEKAVKAAAKAAAEQETTAEENAPAAIPEVPQEVTALAEIKPFDIATLIAMPVTEESAPEAEPEAKESTEQAREETESMEIHYNVTGPRRKELATAVGNFIGTAPVYMKAPTYGLAVSNYIIDKNGTLTGESNKALAEALAEQGFTAA